jgi:hypothetical protein
MSDTTRVVLIALGVALIVVVLLPFVFMGGMMGAMMGGGMMGGGAPWMMLSLPLLALLTGAVLLVLGLRRRR